MDKKYYDTKKNTIWWIKWYHDLDLNEKKEFNRKRYLRAKAKKLSKEKNII